MTWVRPTFDDPADLDRHFSGDPAELVDAMASLLLAMQRPAWMRNAACRGTSTAVFFPPRGIPVTEAKRVCAGCPVRAECEAYAVEVEGPLAGVWGGLSERERQVRRSAA